MSNPIIRKLEHSDFPGWLPLWDQNNLGQRNETVTTETWARICDPDHAVHGLCALDGDRLVGLAHYVLHPTTGSLQPACYVQDVYVDPAQRGKGIGTKLIKAIAKIGGREKWARMYWLADANDAAAQGLYKNLGVKLNFSLHVMPLNM